MSDPEEVRYCKCGCGEIVKFDYVRGHHMRGIKEERDPLLNNLAIQKELSAKAQAEEEEDLQITSEDSEDIDDAPILLMDDDKEDTPILMDEEVKTELGRKLTYAEIVALEETDNWSYLSEDEFDLSTFPDGRLPETVLSVFKKECPVCGSEHSLDHLFKGKKVCEECYKKMKSIKSKKELFEWLKEIGVEEEELIPEQDEEYSGDNP